MGFLNLTSYTLKSAIGEYDVQITDDAATLNPPGMPVILATANNTLVDHNPNSIDGYHPSTLAGIVNGFVSSYSGMVWYKGSHQFGTTSTNAKGWGALENFIEA